MHRVATFRPVIYGVVLALVTVTVGCAGQNVKKPELEEPAKVERLRLKITKVRNAIEETRGTIARSRGAPYITELYLRLAELLSEEARYHYQLAAERQQSKGGLSNVPQVRLLKKHAIDIYKMMLRRFEGSPQIPRVLFNLGHEHRELGNFTKMRAALNELIDEHEDSPLRNNALLVVGDYYFDRSKLGQAADYYRKITRASLNQVSGLGHYKLAWVEINLGDCEAALDDFEEAIAKSKKWEASYGEGADSSGVDVKGSSPAERATSAARADIDVRREALVDLTYCYSREREVDESVEYLQERAYNRAAFVAALARLAHRYRLNDNYDGAVLVTRELMRLGPSNRDRIEDARTFYTALESQDEFRNIGEDTRLISDALTQFFSQVAVGDQERQRLREEFEKYIRDLATKAQTQLKKKMGTLEEPTSEGGEPPTDVESEELARQVAESYRVYTETFPRAVKIPDMLLNMAETLSVLDRNLDAGKKALRAGSLMKKGDEQRDALYDAVVYFQKSLDQPVDRREFERVSARASLRRAARRLLPYKLEKKKERRVKYAIAQSYYDEGRYLHAIDQLSAVAYEFPNSEEADAAIQLVLDSYDTLNDYDGLRFASRRFLQNDSPASKKLRADIKQILDGAQQRKLDELSLKAAGDQGGDLSPLLEFAKKHKGQKMGERSLINAFVAARSMGETNKMYELAEKIAAQYPKSEQLPGIYTTVAQMARARFEFQKAIQFMERAASVNPDQRIQLLVAAGEIYEQLGVPSKAEKMYREAIDVADGAQVGLPAGRLASLLERHVSAGELARKLEPYASTGNPQVLSRLGLAYVAQGKTSKAESAFNQVLQGGSGATVEATARAQYGMAESLFSALKQYSSPDSLRRVQEFIALIEVAQQKYIGAARQGSGVYTAVSLSRLAAMLNYAADRLESLKLPGGLSSAEKSQVRKALKARVDATRAGAKDALKTCSNQLWASKNFSPVVRKCLEDQPLSQTMPPFDSITKGSVSSSPSGIKKLRQRVSKNPEDVETLRKLGSKFLKSGSPHAARIVFAEAVQAGGGPKEQNLLGIALVKINDMTGAFEAFANAAKGGLEAGRQNIASVLEQSGLSKMAQQALEKFPKGEPGGRRLSANVEVDKADVQLAAQQTLGSLQK